MADSAQPEGEIVVTTAAGNAAYHPAIPRLAIPIVAGNVPLGGAVADTIQTLLDCFPLAIEAETRTALGQLQQWMRSKSFVPHRGQSQKHRHEIHPLRGRISSAPYYAALVRQSADQSQYDSLRAIVLGFTLSQSPPRGSHTAVDLLARRLRNPEGIDALDAVQRIDENLRSGDYSAKVIAADLNTVVDGTQGHWQALIRACFTEPVSDVELSDEQAKTTTPPDQFVKPPVNQFTEPRTPEDEEIHDDEPLDDQVLVDEWYAPNLTDHSSRDPEGADDYDDVLCIDEQVSPAVAEYIYAERTRHHLQGALLADTERTLTRLDSAVLWSELRESIEASAMSPSRINALACDVVIATMLATGRSRRTCAAALLYLLEIQDQGSDDFVLAIDHFVGSLPIEYPGTGDAPKAWFYPVKDSIRLQLPPDLVHAISQLQMLSSDTAYGWELQLSEADIVTRLRSYRAVVPTLTETRLANCLPIAVYTQTGHTRESLIITGDDAFRSSASLHYPYYESQRLQTIYNTALASLGIATPLKSSDLRARYIGARRGAMKLDKVHAAVSALTERTASAVINAEALPDLIEAHNLLAAYTCVLFGFATANRFTESIGHVTRRDILSCSATENDDTSVIGLVHDKGKAPAIDQRVCALPPVIGKQITALLKRDQKLRARLKRVLGNSWIHVVAALDAACNGTGPLWFSIDSGNKDVSKLNRAVLRELWPEWKPPIEWARHLFASSLADFGMNGGDIAQHMGHRIDSPAFSSVDPDCPIDFGVRCAPAISAYLEKLGFAHLGDIQRRNRAVPDPNLVPASDIVLQAGTDLDVVSEINEEEIPITGKEEEEAMRRVTEFLSEQPPHPIYVVDPRKIDDWLNASQSNRNASRAVQAAVRSALAQQLAVMSEISAGKKLPAVPQLRRRQWEPASIRSTHFDAVRWARCAHDWAFDAIAERRQLTPTKEIVCGIVLIACWGMGTTRQRIIQLLSASTALHSAGELRGHAAAALHTEDDDPRYLQTQTIPMDAVALLARLRALLAESDARTYIDDAWQDAETFLPRLGSRKRKPPLDLALAVIALARQVTTGGDRAAWERGDLRAVGPVPERYFAALQNNLRKQERGPDVVSINTIQRPIKADVTEDMRLFREMRKSVWYVKSHRNAGHYRALLNNNLREIANELPQSCVIGMMASLVRQRLEGDGLEWSSLHGYISTLAQLVRKIGALDLAALEPATLIDPARLMILTYETSGKTRKREKADSVISALSWLLNGFDAIGIDIDLGEITEGLRHSGPRKGGFWISSKEQRWVLGQLSAWTESVYADTGQLGRAQDFAAAELGARIQLSNALRQGEVSHLKVTDLRINGEWVQANVRPRASHTLKRIASKRPTQVSTSQDYTERISALRDRIQNRRLDTDSELLSTAFRMAHTAIASRNSATFRASCSAVIPISYARSHVGRHDFASAVGFTLRAHAFRGVTLHLPHHEWLKTDWLSALPVRVRLMYFSRQLGHGHPNSTLEYYDHTVPLLLDTARHWRTLSTKANAELLGARPAAYRKALYRFETAEKKTQPPWLSYVDVDWHADPMDECIELEPPPVPSGSTNERLLETTGEVALGLRQGLAADTLANEIGLSERIADDLDFELRHCASFLRLPYLPESGSNETTSSRRPRAGRLSPILHALDQAIADGSLSFLAVLDWCERNVSKASKTELGFGNGDAVIREAFSSQGPFKKAAHNSEFLEVKTLRQHERQWFLLVCYTASHIRVKEWAGEHDTPFDEETPSDKVAESNEYQM